MHKEPASIFNDVLGPIMRGASSSHVAASVRIGHICRQLVKGRLIQATFEFNKEGSLATTYHGHGSDIGLVSGLLGYETDDDRLVDALSIAEKEGLDVQFHVVDYQADHPNTYRIILKTDQHEILKATAISTGGGMIQFNDIEGFSVDIQGGFYEGLIFLDHEDQVGQVIKNYEDARVIKKGSQYLINIKSTRPLKDLAHEGVITLKPVLPIASLKTYDIPFKTAKDMLAKGRDKALWQLALDYEAARGGISQEQVYEKMQYIVGIMSKGIKLGLKGTEFEDRILDQQSHLIEKHKSMLLPSGIVNRMIAYVTALMEIKSAMEVFVAAPTAGSCGGLPGTILSVVDELGLSEDHAIKAMLSAGMIGVLLAEHSTFAAEVAGCQAECGNGSSMAAAGLVDLMGGSAQACVDAASLALQNVMGMVCDPVGDRVEVPCLGKNVLAGSNAISSANMILAGFDTVVPLDETIQAAYKVGQMIAPELRCTGYGGLSITPTSKRIYKTLNG